jgi:hypothetical protein
MNYEYHHTHGHDNIYVKSFGTNAFPGNGAKNACWYFLASLLEIAMMSRTALMIFLQSYRTGSASARNYHCILPEVFRVSYLYFSQRKAWQKGLT